MLTTVVCITGVCLTVVGIVVPCTKEKVMTDGTTVALTLVGVENPTDVLDFKEIVAGGVAAVIVTYVAILSDDDEMKEDFEVAGVTSIVALTEDFVSVTGYVVLEDTVAGGAGVLLIILAVLGT